MGKQTQRIRLEFRVARHGDRLAIGMDKRLTILRVMMNERFGTEGEIAFNAWALSTAKDVDIISPDEAFEAEPVKPTKRGSRMLRAGGTKCDERS